MTKMTVPSWLRRSVSELEENRSLDPAVERLRPWADTIARGRRGDWLRGEWLGHSLHPLATDFPMGLWAGAGLLDLLGGRRSRTAAQRLVGLGLLFVPVTAASGWTEFSDLEDPRLQRVGAVHAIGNSAVAVLYFMSWRARHKHHHIRGVLLGMLGGSLAWGTGYLGGHMSFARSAGQGSRGLLDAETVSGEASTVGVPV
jgi:uncharacterized membrane protein